MRNEFPGNVPPENVNPESTTSAPAPEVRSKQLFTGWRNWLPLLVLPIFFIITIISRSPVLFLLTLSCLILSVIAYELARLMPASWRRFFWRYADRMPVGTLALARKAEEGIKQLRPFILGMLFLFPPVGLLMMLGHGLRKLFKRQDRVEAPQLSTDETIILRQSISKEQDLAQSNFFFSPAFTATILTVFISGAPAVFVLLLYRALGIDALLGFPSHDPRFTTAFSITGIYIAGLSWCLCTLFFRAWFTFPLNFMSTEHTVQLSEEGVYKSPIKGWYMELLFFLWAEFIPTRLKWSEISSIQCYQGGMGRLSPLPDRLFTRNGLVYKSLNRLAEFTDALVDSLGRNEYILIKSFDKSLRPDVKLRLWELDGDDRARLFYAIRKWGPLVVIDSAAQEALVGSRAMGEARYTQIWFDLLSCRDKRTKEGALAPGDKLHNGNLKITDRLDSGGQANIYLAEENGEPVVVKEFILANENESLVDSARDFENESAILSCMKHPGIVRMLDMFAEDRRAYLVLERVEGMNLRRLIREQGPLPEEQVVELALKMCEILRYLHEQSPPVVHRDFTPDNLILQRDGELRLIDFSVASNTRQYSGDCVGKHSYTSPDQFRGQSTPQSDIYALGATLYFLLTGEDPLPISESHPNKIVTGISAALDEIIAHATKLKVEERYENIGWLKLDLEALNPPTIIRTESETPIAVKTE